MTSTKDAVSTPFLALTAEDLMTRDVVQLSEKMPLRAAAQLLLRHHISGAPVVNAEGKCVGVLSAVDFLRLAEKRDDVTKPAAPAQPMSCSFVKRQSNVSGRDVYLCSLPPGVCSVQVKKRDSEGREQVVCSEPHCVFADWQVVELEQLPADEVRNFMTADPVIVKPGTPIGALARLIIDAHIHRVIVADAAEKPIGIVTSTDILAAVAHAK